MGLFGIGEDKDTTSVRVLFDPLVATVRIDKSVPRKMRGRVDELAWRNVLSQVEFSIESTKQAAGVRSQCLLFVLSVAGTVVGFMAGFFMSFFGGVRGMNGVLACGIGFVFIFVVSLVTLVFLSIRSTSQTNRWVELSVDVLSGNTLGRHFAAPPPEGLATIQSLNQQYCHVLTLEVRKIRTNSFDIFIRLGPNQLYMSPVGPGQQPQQAYMPLAGPSQQPQTYMPPVGPSQQPQQTYMPPIAQPAQMAIPYPVAAPVPAQYTSYDTQPGTSSGSVSAAPVPVQYCPHGVQTPGTSNPFGSSKQDIESSKQDIEYSAL
jgi:hypothetical protein